MPLLCLGLIALAFAISVPATAAARALGLRWNALDSPGSPGHQKVLRHVPNTGGVAIYLALGDATVEGWDEKKIRAFMGG